MPTEAERLHRFRFSDLGADEGVTAPTAEQVQIEDESCRLVATDDGGVLESAVCQALVQTVDDFRAQNPHSRCLHIDGGRAFVRCLDDEGATEVAEPYRTYREALPPASR